MAKSSIHIDKGEVSFLAHNLRKNQTVNSIFNDEENYYFNSFDEAVSLYREELRARAAAYTARTGQKLQSKTTTLFSAILNLNQEHDENDVQKIVDYLEKTLDTKVINYAIHRDEGHVEDGQPMKNYHAHIMFLGLDSKGNSIRRKLTRSYLSKLQSETAKILGMERGVNYAKERKPRPRRLDTYEYKEAKKREEKEKKKLKVTVKELKARIEAYRKQMIEAGIFAAEDYRALGSLKKRLKKETAKEIAEEFVQLKEEYERRILGVAVTMPITIDHNADGRLPLDRKEWDYVPKKNFRAFRHKKEDAEVVDQGRRIIAYGRSVTAKAVGMLAIAKAKGWTRVVVSGTLQLIEAIKELAPRYGVIDVFAPQLEERPRHDHDIDREERSHHDLDRDREERSRPIRRP